MRAVRPFGSRIDANKMFLKIAAQAFDSQIWLTGPFG